MSWNPNAMVRVAAASDWQDEAHTHDMDMAYNLAQVVRALLPFATCARGSAAAVQDAHAVLRQYETGGL